MHDDDDDDDDDDEYCMSIALHSNTDLCSECSLRYNRIVLCLKFCHFAFWVIIKTDRTWLNIQCVSHLSAGPDNAL